ncbi:hypothetical protein BKA82DRAFT_4019966 [Pisolithus tinctorius]|nr:hypothetical protein BKA82DRAFT_4019966 [Pisolithus tinctorius]
MWCTCCGVPDCMLSGRSLKKLGGVGVEKSIFDQVFKASWEGTAVEVVRAAMAEHGVAEPSSACNAPPAQASSSCDVSHVVLSPQAPSSQTCKLMFTFSFGSLTNHSIRQKLAQIPLLSMPSKVSKNEQDKEEDELDDEANHCPRVTEIALSGLKAFFIAMVVRGVQKGQGRRHISRAQFTVSKIVWRWVQIGLSQEYSRSCCPLIVPVPMEEMEPFAQPSDIPVHSWVHLLTSGLKNEIAYVKCIEGNLVYLLVIPWNLPYISSGENSMAHCELFDVDLAHQHGLERPNIELVGDCGKIQAREFVNKVAYIAMDIQELPTSLEISIHDSKCKFRSGDSVDVIAGPHHGFEGMFRVFGVKSFANACS